VKEIKVGYEKSSQILNKDISHKMEIKQQQCDKQILAVKQEINELKSSLEQKIKSENNEIMKVLVKISEQVEKIANPPKPRAPEVKDDNEIELNK